MHSSIVGALKVIRGNRNAITFAALMLIIIRLVAVTPFLISAESSRQYIFLWLLASVIYLLGSAFVAALVSCGLNASGELKFTRPSLRQVMWIGVYPMIHMLALVLLSVPWFVYFFSDANFNTLLKTDLFRETSFAVIYCVLVWSIFEAKTFLVFPRLFIARVTLPEAIAFSWRNTRANALGLVLTHVVWLSLVTSLGLLNLKIRDAGVEMASTYYATNAAQFVVLSGGHLVLCIMAVILSYSAVNGSILKTDK